jgi:hypothetical protein
MVAGTLAYTAAANLPTNRHYASLSGAQEVPGPGDPNAAGVALVNVKPTTNEVCVKIRFARVDGTLTGLHIHDGPRGVAGPIVVDLTSALSSDGIGCATTSAATIAAIKANPRRFYCNLHSTSFGDGAIRSQLFDSDI